MDIIYFIRTNKKKIFIGLGLLCIIIITIVVFLLFQNNIIDDIKSNLQETKIKPSIKWIVASIPVVLLLLIIFIPKILIYTNAGKALDIFYSILGGLSVIVIFLSLPTMVILFAFGILGNSGDLIFYGIILLVIDIILFTFMGGKSTKKEKIKETLKMVGWISYGIIPILIIVVLMTCGRR